MKRVKATGAISNNIETRVIKFFSARQGPKEIHAIPIEQLGEHAPPYATVKNQLAQFKHVYFSTCDAPRPGLPKQWPQRRSFLNLFIKFTS
jgi:hypothetical protein